MCEAAQKRELSDYKLELARQDRGDVESFNRFGQERLFKVDHFPDLVTDPKAQLASGTFKALS